MSLLIVLAGPNGSGKSTLMTEVIKSPHFPEYYFCPDEIVKDYNHISDVKERYISAMEEAEALRVAAVEDNLPIAFETVFSTREKLDFIRDAKKMGYYVELIYITTRDPGINQMRVAQRACTGGHDVPPDKVVSRYERSMALLPEIIQTADTVKVYDNSDSSPFIVFFKRASGEIMLLNKNKRYEWVDKYIIEPLTCCGFINGQLMDLDEKDTESYMENAYTDRIEFLGR